MRKRYNTPHRSRVVKTRMTEEEYAEFAERLSAYNMSQAEFIRQAITGAAIRPIITVSLVIDGGNGYDGAYGCPGYGLPDKLGLAHVAGRKPFRKLGIFFLGHACLDYPAAVRRVVSFSHGKNLLSAVRGLLSLIGEKQGVKRNCF